MLPTPAWPRTLREAYSIAQRVAREAGNASARSGSRSEWNDDDQEVADSAARAAYERFGFVDALGDPTNVFWAWRLQPSAALPERLDGEVEHIVRSAIDDVRALARSSARLIALAPRARERRDAQERVDELTGKLRVYAGAADLPLDRLLEIANQHIVIADILAAAARRRAA